MTAPSLKRNAFSLVEACIAIGLTAFCLVALLGLFQIGLTQERTAVDQVRAAHILAAISDEFRGLTRLPDGKASTQAVGARFGLSLPAPGSGPRQPPQSLAVDEQGDQATGNPAYVVHYWITPPTQLQGAYAPYRLRAVVAWPGTAAFQNTGGDLQVKNARGSVETTLELNRE